MQKHARFWFKKVVQGKKPKFTSSFHKTLAGIAKRRTGTGAGAQDWRSFLDFMSILTEHLPANYETVIQSINFRGNKATIRGEAADVDSFEELAKGLEASGKFEVRTPFRIRSGRRNGPARLAFTIELSPRRS